MNKPVLVESGLAIDLPHTFSVELKAKLIIHPDFVQKIINFDKTSHLFSTQGDKGGSRNNMYGYPSLYADSIRDIRAA